MRCSSTASFLAAFAIGAAIGAACAALYTPVSGSQARYRLDDCGSAAKERLTDAGKQVIHVLYNVFAELEYISNRGAEVLIEEEIL